MPMGLDRRYPLGRESSRGRIDIHDLWILEPSAPRCSVRGAARFVRHTTVHSNHEQRSKSARTPLLDTGKTGNESAADGLADYP